MSSALSLYLTAVKRWWTIPVVTLLLAVTAASAMLLTKPVQYQSMAAFFISTPRDDASSQYRGNLYAQERMSSYAALVASTDLASRVVAKTGIDMDPAELAAGATLTPLPQSVLLSLSVRAPDPHTAQLAAIGYADELQQEVATLETVPGALNPRSELIMVQSPTFDPKPAGLPWWMLVGAAAVAGLFLGLIGVALRSLVDDRVREPDDAARLVEAPLLATVETASAADPASNDRFADRLEDARSLRTAIDSAVGAGRAAFQIVDAARGDDAASAALALGLVLEERGQAVVIVDFGSSVSDVIAPDDHAVTLVDLLSGRVSVEHVQANYHDVCVVPSGDCPSPGGLPDDPNWPQVFDQLRAYFDTVIVCTASATTRSDAARLAGGAGEVIMVCRYGGTRETELLRVTDEITASGGTAIGIIVARPPKRTFGRVARDGDDRQNNDVERVTAG